MGNTVMTKSKSFREILTKPATANVETNVPARLLREILARVGVSPMEWEELTNQHYRSKHGDDVRKIREEKTNLASALEKDRISWDRFEQALTILGPDRFKVTVELTYPRGLTVDSTVSVRTGKRKTMGTAQVVEDIEDES